MGVQVERVFVQKITTKWGSCHPTARNICLNTDLAKNPAQCREYVVLHELTQLLERYRSERLVAMLLTAFFNGLDRTVWRKL